MYLEEREEGAYRVYAAALATTGRARAGYLAAVVVKRRGPTDSLTPASVEAYRCERLSRGRRWTSPEKALAFALATGVAFAKMTEFREQMRQDRPVFGMPLGSAFGAHSTST